MKELTFTPMSERVKWVADETASKVKFHSQSQKVIDAVRYNRWLAGQEKAGGSAEVSTYFWKELTIHIYNVEITDFIENVLGPLHQRFGYWWELEIGGEESDPVFVFKKIHDSYSNGKLHFLVKEGEFKSCAVVRELVGRTEARFTEPEPIYKLALNCS